MIQITRNPISTVVSYSYSPAAVLAHAVVDPKSNIQRNVNTGTCELVLSKSEFKRWLRLMRPVAMYCVHCDEPDNPFWVRQYEIDEADGQMDCEHCGALCKRASGPVANIIPSWVTEFWSANGMVPS